MLLRPNPGRVRAVMRAAGQAKSRPRPISAIAPSPLQPRSFHSIRVANRLANFRASSTRSIHSTATAARSATFTALLKQLLSRATRAVRISLAKQIQPNRINFRTLLSSLRSPHLSYRVRSPLLKGAINAFRSTAKRTSAQSTRTAYSQLNATSVSFARGTLSGIGARPAAGSLAISPLRGGVGLQTARKFSSGGARVFDNLIVNAPLALRLAGDEVEDKVKMARKQPIGSARRTASASKTIGARRTAGTFSGDKLAKKALLFATKAKHTVEQTNTTSLSCSSVTTTSDSETPAQLDLYFQFPQLDLPTTITSTTTLVTIRLIDPLFLALGGRHPSAPTNSSNPRLFDSAFLHDATTALEYEHRRYLKAKAVLKVLWDAGLVKDVDMEGEEGTWTVMVRGKRRDVEEVVRSRVDFGIDGWCVFEEESRERTGGLDLSYVHEDLEGSSQFDRVTTPTLSSTEQVVALQHSVSSDELISLPSLVSDSHDSLLYDSRSQL
ncbi:hypothetical protein PHSY_000782 [Pseudozyma hubeiensis SY62]|uniref:Uncharacterized protein n=1 Tax=Pseudozyma hubeiensis (strain SY62) TaxID=1305764 RepID=R9NXA2_PSEHS|nr:hypothetical protein PHSY_000782 [Pseudozyma hubeiensis SY62]GAC93219.1 hypothetical protein PHSY_000782 [Pseudozyma hubeiensis SY62]